MLIPDQDTGILWVLVLLPVYSVTRYWYIQLTSLLLRRIRHYFTFLLARSQPHPTTEVTYLPALAATHLPLCLQYGVGPVHTMCFTHS